MTLNQADLEKEAIDQAFQEQIRAAFSVLMDNVALREDGAGAKFKIAVTVARLARSAAIEAIGVTR